MSKPVVLTRDPASGVIDESVTVVESRLISSVSSEPTPQRGHTSNSRKPIYIYRERG